MEIRPAVIPHDKDEERREPEPNPDETKNPPTKVTRTQRMPDGTEVEVPAEE